MTATATKEIKPEVIKSNTEYQNKINSLRASSESKTFIGATQWVTGMISTVTVIFAPFSIVQKYDVTLPKTEVELIDSGLIILGTAALLFYKGFKNLQTSGKINEEIRTLEEIKNEQNLKALIRK